MKLLLICYYELKESLLGASNALKQHDIEIISYPLIKYKNELGDNYINHFKQFIKNENPDIILWWILHLRTDHFIQICEESPDTKQIYFNWDEPHNWTSEYIDHKNKAKYLDYVFVTCKESLQDYLNNGTSKALCLYPGHDPVIFRPFIHDDPNDNKYKCDISICCTNLYDDLDSYPDQLVNRKDMIDTIYANQQKYKYKFNIYGGETLKSLYPDSYKGFIKYEDTAKVFNYSKINLCTHCLSNKTGYLNERVILILASGGLLFVDNIKGLDKVLTPGYHCVVYEKFNYMDKMLDILKNYDEYYIMKFRANKKSNEFTWTEWAKTINDECFNDLK
jgi:hypothetical protein